jgi:AraC family transcriptional regulator, regulatory protein of adaptative response / DNA-3-methyladenine glycosylase II
MLLDPDHCYQALQAHDARFDGRFFVGVSSTGIYCRPVCSVRTPKRQNCRFFPSAAAAESEGYRPCLRCRPELAPGNAGVDAAERLAQAAAGLIEDGETNDAGLEPLSERLGVSSRHLRRVFDAAFGVSPVEYAQTQRLLLAKRLLTDTGLPVTEIALASGFGSLRRFNALFRQRYRLNPSDLRKAVRSPAGEEALYFELGFRPPLDWPALLGFLGKRAIDGVEDVSDGCYRRTVAIAAGGRGLRGWLSVTCAPDKPVLKVALSASLAGAIPMLLARVKRVFDLACDPRRVGDVLGVLGAGRPGLRLPGAFDGFELAVRAVLGQQITVRAARTLAGRFATAFGDPVETPSAALHHVFPAATRVATLAQPEISALGIVSARANAILALARSLSDGALRLEPGADVALTLDALRALPGIGEWTAQYIAMRALSWPDAFPHTDYGVLKALGTKNPREALERAAQWQPWRGYAVMHLWHSLEGTAQ